MTHQVLEYRMVQTYVLSYRRQRLLANLKTCGENPTQRVNRGEAVSMKDMAIEALAELNAR